MRVKSLPNDFLTGLGMSEDVVQDQKGAHMY